MNPAKVHVSFEESDSCPAARELKRGCQAWERGATDDDWYCDADHCPYRDGQHVISSGRPRVTHSDGQPWPRRA